MPSFLDTRLQDARELVLRFGRNSTAYQILNPGFDLWFSRGGDTVIGYVSRHGIRVVGGNPICDEARIGSAVEEFSSDAHRHGETVAYFAADEELVAYGESVVLGSEACWRPDDWQHALHTKASLRAQINRARNKGVEVHELLGRPVVTEPLSSCLDEWLESRPLPTLHFLIEPRTLVRVLDRRIYVAKRDESVVGFLVTSPIPARNGWLIEQIVRSDNAPNGTAELLFHNVLETLREESSDLVSFGLAPLSKRSGASVKSPVWIEVMFQILRSAGSPFYHFAGLERFKAKLQPSRWEPNYLVSPDAPISIGTFVSIASAFAAQPIGGLAIGAVERLVRRGFAASP